MHNLHLVVIKADTPEDACRDVEAYIEDFGNDNNWRCIGGALSKNNVAYDHDDYSRWKPSEDGLNTIDKINKMVGGWLKPEFNYGKTYADQIEGSEKKFGDLSGYELRQLKDYVKHLSELADIDTKAFNILEDEFYPYAYDENGVTQIDYQDGEETYVVFVDMHS
jgi:hypothetical protein